MIDDQVASTAGSILRPFSDQVQKVASTTWKRTFVSLTGKMNSEDFQLIEREQGHPRNPSRFVHNNTVLFNLGIKRLSKYKDDEVCIVDMTRHRLGRSSKNFSSAHFY